MKLSDTHPTTQQPQEHPPYAAVKSAWAETELWSKLHGDLLALPDQGRFKGLCESWHCAAWQLGRNGAAMAVLIAKRHGWEPHKHSDQRQQAIFRGHLAMAKTGDEHVAKVRLARRQKVPNVQGENIGVVWRRHRARVAMVGELVGEAG